MIEKVGKRSFLLMIAHSLVIGGNAGAHFILASILSPEVYGSVFFFLTLLNFVLMFAVFGFQHVIMHQAPRLEEKKDYTGLTDLVYGSWNIAVIFSFIAMATIAIWHFYIMPIEMTGATGAILSLFFIAPIWAFLKISLPFLLSRGATFSGVVPDQGLQALGFFVVPALVYFGIASMNKTALSSVPLILSGQIIAGLLGVIITLFFVRRYFKQIGQYKFTFLKPIKRWKALSIPFFIFSLVQQAFQRADLLLIGILAGPKNLAIYAVCLKIAQILNFPAMASKAALAPRFSSLFEKGNHKKLRQLLISSTVSLAIIGIVIGAGLYQLSPFILNMIGDVYMGESIKILPILIIAEIFVCVFTPIKMKALMGQSQKFLSVIFSIGLVLSLILNFYFIPLYGIMAVALIRLFVMFVIHFLIFLNLGRKSISANTEF